MRSWGRGQEGEICQNQKIRKCGYSNGMRPESEGIGWKTVCSWESKGNGLIGVDFCEDSCGFEGRIRDFLLPFPEVFRLRR